jgi:hypothetical protein
MGIDSHTHEMAAIAGVGERVGQHAGMGGEIQIRRVV